MSDIADQKEINRLNAEVEALRGENARLTTQVRFASETDPAMRAEAAEAEAARLKGALEALAGERDAWEKAAREHLDWRERNRERANAAEAERDRLKAALDIAKAHAKQNQRARDLVSPYPNDHAKRIVWEKALYHEGKDLWDKLRKALEDDKQ